MQKKPYKRYEGNANDVLIAFIGYVNDINKLQQFKVSVQKSHHRLQCTFQEHEKSGIYKIMCKTCYKVYVGQTSRKLKSRFREHIRYIKNNDPRSAYALHILNCRHEYGNIDDTMTLLTQINTPTLLLPYEQMYIQSFHHNNELIPEQHLNDHNPMFDFLHSNTTRHNLPDA